MVGQLEYVVEIAGNLNGRVQISLNFPTGCIRDFLGQKIPLNPAAFFHFKIQRAGVNLDFLFGLCNAMKRFFQF